MLREGYQNAWGGLRIYILCNHGNKNLGNALYRLEMGITPFKPSKINGPNLLERN